MCCANLLSHVKIAHEYSAFRKILSYQLAMAWQVSIKVFVYIFEILITLNVNAISGVINPFVIINLSSQLTNFTVFTSGVASWERRRFLHTLKTTYSRKLHKWMGEALVECLKLALIAWLGWATLSLLLMRMNDRSLS